MLLFGHLFSQLKLLLAVLVYVKFGLLLVEVRHQVLHGWLSLLGLLRSCKHLLLCLDRLFLLIDLGLHLLQLAGSYD